MRIFLLKFSYLIFPEDLLESNYRLNRLIYKDPCDRYEENSGYQVCNGYIAINNGDGNDTVYVTNMTKNI